MIKLKIITFIFLILISIANLTYFTINHDLIFNAKKILASNICSDYLTKRKINVSNNFDIKSIEKKDVQLFELAAIYASRADTLYDDISENPLSPWGQLILSVSWLSDGPVTESEIENARNNFQGLFTLTYEDIKNISLKDFTLTQYCDEYFAYKKNNYDYKLFFKRNYITPVDKIVETFFASENTIKTLTKKYTILNDVYNNKQNDDFITDKQINDFNVENNYRYDNKPSLYSGIPELLKFADKMFSFNSFSEFEIAIEKEATERRNKPLPGEIKKIKITDNLDVKFAKQFGNNIVIFGKNIIKENGLDIKVDLLIYSLKEERIVWKSIGEHVLDSHEIAVNGNKIAFLKNSENKSDHKLVIMDLINGFSVEEIENSPGLETVEIIKYTDDDLIVKQKSLNYNHSYDRIYNISKKQTYGKIYQFNGKRAISNNLELITNYNSNNGCLYTNIYDHKLDKSLLDGCSQDLDVAYANIELFYTNDKLSYFATNEKNQYYKIEVDLKDYKPVKSNLDPLEASKLNFGGKFGLNIDSNSFVNYNYFNQFNIQSGNKKIIIKPHYSKGISDYYFLSDDRKLLYLSSRYEGLVALNLNDILNSK